jgi:hypothetical protein
MTQALFPQIKPLSSKPTPAELSEFSLAVRAALGVMQSVQVQVATLDKQVSAVVASSTTGTTSGTETAVEVIEAPTTLTGFTVTGLFAKIMATWDEPGYEGHAYTEIWRAQVDDLGQAVLVDKATYLLWVDNNLPSNSLGEGYYYWGRHVNRNGDAGAFNAVEGTLGRTADDPDYLLEIAAEKWQASYDYALAELTMPTLPNGYCYEVTVDGGSSGEAEPVWPTVIDETVTDGDLTWKCKAAFSFEQFFKLALVDGVPRLTLKDLYLADGIIKRAMIGLLAVDDARMESCSVSKLLAGIIQAAGIYVGASSRIHIDGANERIVVKDGLGTTRVVLGKTGTDSWGLLVYDASGNTVINANGELSVDAIAGLGDLATLDGFTLANIDSYFETAAIGSALIANAAVSTLKIGMDAVTVPVSAFTSGTISLTGSWQTVQSAVLNSEGYPIFISFSASCSKGGPAGGSGDLYVYLRIADDTGEKLAEQLVLTASPTLPPGGIVWEWHLSSMVPFTWRYVPVSGSRTVRIQMRASEYVSVTVRSLYCGGIKR